MNKTIVVIALGFSAMTVHSQQAMVRVGDSSCPVGYSTSGQYCVPNGNATPALVRTLDSSCPIGYMTSGHYCVATKLNAPHTMPRVGSCPTGYHTSGQYCISAK